MANNLFMRELDSQVSDFNRMFFVFCQILPLIALIIRERLSIDIRQVITYSFGYFSSIITAQKSKTFIAADFDFCTIFLLNFKFCLMNINYLSYFSGKTD